APFRLGPRPRPRSEAAEADSGWLSTPHKSQPGPWRAQRGARSGPVWVRSYAQARAAERFDFGVGLPGVGLPAAALPPDLRAPFVVDLRAPFVVDFVRRGVPSRSWAICSARSVRSHVKSERPK